MNKMKKLIFEVGLDFKKEVIINLVINALIISAFLAFSFIFKQFFILFIMLLAILIFNFFYFSRYSNMKNKLENKRLQEFVSLFTYFEIYIKNGMNIYIALQNITAFASPFIKEKLDILLFEMDSDKTVNPFIHFSKNFKSLLIEQMLVSIYQMIDQGNSTSYLLQFQHLFGKISDEQHHKEVVERTKKIDSLSVTPLIGASMITIIITIGIVTIIGGIISGL
jgi:hypothetical protein